MHDLFRKFSAHAAHAVGTAWAFILALLVVIVWATTGPMFGFSDTWQLVINTSTTIVTFLMVFLIQNTQNRDARAIHLRLDELIRAKKGARNKLVDLEDCTDEEIEQLEREFQDFRQRRGKDGAIDDTGTERLGSKRRAIAKSADTLIGRAHPEKPAHP